MLTVRLRWFAVSLAALAVCAIAPRASAAFATLHFENPSGWSVGDANSTHQAWDNFASVSGAAPDVSYVVSPSGLSTPTSSASPAVLTGTMNYYWFGGNYGVELDIFNHGGATGTLSGGTHVIVQAASTIGAGGGTILDSLQILKQDGSSLLGGPNAEALRQEELFGGVVDSIMGPVNYQEYVWEFFLADWTGDFSIEWDQTQHASLDAVRVDTMIADQAFALASVPEPSSFAMISVGLAGVAMLRRRKRSQHAA